MSEKYYQCRMRRVDCERVQETVGWIEAKGAKVGLYVELLPSGEEWRVVEVYTSMDADILRETQRQRRKPPPSIRDTKKDRQQQKESSL